MRQLTVAATLVAALGLATAVARADLPPTPADLQRLIDAGDYRAAVAGANRLIALTGEAAAGVDLSAAYAIKGEAHLHLRQFPQAADAFGAAARAAGDPAVAATDRATEVLVRRSHDGTYSPKQPGAKGTRVPPIDVVPSGNRKAAFAFLFADEFAAAGGKLKAAATAQAVPQLLAAADLAGTLRQLELAATGSDDKSRPAVAAVTDHAHELLSARLTLMARRVADIAKAANANTTYYARSTTPGRAGSGAMLKRTRKVGLTPQNKSELADIASTCQRLVPAADALGRATAGAAAGSATGAKGGGWDVLSADATRTASQASDVLSADYGNGLDDKP